MHPFFLFNGRRRGGSAARCDALLKTFPRDAAASFSAQVLHSRPRRHAEFHDDDPLKSFQESPHKVDLVPREGHSARTCAKTGALSSVLVWDEKPKSATSRTSFSPNQVRDVALLGFSSQTSTQEQAPVFLRWNAPRAPLCGGNVRPKYPTGPPPGLGGRPYSTVWYRQTTVYLVRVPTVCRPGQAKKSQGKSP